MAEPPRRARWIPAPVQRLLDATRPYHKVSAFLAGFLYDSLTLRRVDRVLDNVILATYLVLLGLLLVLDRRLERGRAPLRWLAGRRHQVQVAARFFFGGLYSAYVVFYFKSASSGPTLLFLGLLVALFIGNEFLERRFSGERIQVLLYTFCLFSFFLFFVPVCTGWVGFGVFCLAGLLALAGTALISLLTMLGGGELRRQVLTRHLPLAGLLLTLLALLYQLNVIPPVPFSLLHAGIYQEVERTPAGYRLVYEAAPWYRPWQRSDRVVHPTPGGRACCFTAVFAPHGIRFEVRHHWEWWDPERRRWRQTDRIPFAARGGRDGGYRGYTCKSKLRAGAWRVRVASHTDQDLGWVTFQVAADSPDGPRRQTSLTY